MEEAKLKLNEVYIKNIWLRVIVAFTVSLLLAVIITLFIGVLISPVLLLIGILDRTKNLGLPEGLMWFVGIYLFLCFLLLFSATLNFFGEQYLPEKSETAARSIRRGNFNMVVNHSLATEEALSRVRTLLGDVKMRHADKIEALEEVWDGNTGNFTLTAMGYTISGTLVVELEKVELYGNIPFPASLAKGKIETMIREQATIHLAK